MPLKSRMSLKTTVLLLSLPTNWDLIVCKTQRLNKAFTVFYLYSSVYFFKLTMPSYASQLRFNSNLRLINISFFYFYHSLTFYFNFITSLFQTFHLPFFLKLKFKGKGYYIFKNSRNTVTPQFGFSHRIYIYSFSILVKFLSKTKIFLFGLSKNDLIRNGFRIKQIRPINVFTGRGIRFAKQIIYRKVGKVSSYR